MNLNAEGGDMLKQSITKSTGPGANEMASIAAMAMRSVKNNNRSKAFEKWFRFLLQQYKADEFMTTGVAKTYLSVYFAITTMGITDWNGMDDFYFGYKLDTTFDLIVRLVMLALILASTGLFAWGFAIEEKISSCPSPVIIMSSHLRYINSYLVLPLCLWLYSKDLFQPEASVKDSGLYVFSWILISTSFLVYILSIFMRSHLPTRGKLNTPYRMTEAAIYITMAILMLLTRISTKYNFKNTIQTVSITLSCLAMFAAWLMQVFWWKSINNFYLIGFVCMNAVRIVIRVLQESNQKPNFMEYLAYVSIFVAVFGRLAYNLTSHRLIQRIEASTRASNQDNYVLYFSYDLCQEAEDAELSGRLPRGLLFYLSQTGRESSRKELSARQRLRESQVTDNPYLRYTEDGSSISQSGKKAQPSGEYSTRLHDPLWAYYRTMSVSKPTSTDELFVYLLLQLIFLNKNLMTISPTLLQYKKLLGSQSRSSLNLFLIESLLVGRLENLSTQEHRDSSSSSRPTLSGIISEITRDLESSMSSEGAYFSKMRFLSSRIRKAGAENSTLILDLSRALTIKTEYLEAMCKVNKLIDVKSDIFTMLFEKYIHKSSYLYQKNKIARDVASQLDQIFNVLLLNELVPNYVLAAALSYYLKVRFDIQKTEKFFKLYQTRLSKFHSLSLNPTKEITESNFQFSSVVIKVNIAQDLTLGMIADISPNYADFLGVAEFNDPTRVNINSLFPGKMSQTHVKMMRATADQPIFNIQKDFQLNGFDGILKPLRYMLKLDNSVSAGLHSMVLLKFPPSRQKSLLLVDENLEVVSAEQEFWQTLEALRCQPIVEKLGNFSETLALQIALMKFLKGSEEKLFVVDNENSTEPGGSLASDSVAAGGKIVDNANRGDEDSSTVLGSGSQEFSYQKLKHRVLENFQTYENSGILHVMSDQMRLPMGLSGLPFLTNIELAPFGKEKYYRIWVTFDLNYNKEARNIKMMARSPRASHYNLTMTGDPFMGKPQTVVNNKLSDSDNNALGDGGDTVGSIPAGMKAGMAAKELAPDTFGFEHVLLKLKKTSPIVALVTEASQRNYPPEIKAALTWIQDFYKASEAAGEKNYLAQLDRARTAMRSLAFSDNVVELGRSDIQRPARTLDAMRVNTLVIDAAMTPQASGIDNWGDAFNDQLKTQRGDVHSAASIPNSPRPGSPDYAQFEFAKVEAPRIEKKFLRDPKNQVMPRQRSDRPEAKFISDNKEISKADVRIIPIGREQTQANIKIEWADAKQPTTGTFGKTKSGVINKGAKVIKVHPSGFHTLGSEKKSQTVKFIHEDGEPRKMPEDPPENSGTEHKSTVFSQVLRKLFKYRNSRYLAGREDKDSKGQKKDEVNPLILQAASQQNQMTSLNEHNVQLISRYMSDFKLVRRAEFLPDAEKNASVSTKNSSSKTTHFIKAVNSTLQTKRKGDFVIWLAWAMALFTVYFVTILEYTLTSITSYNDSNNNNFLLLSDFILMDRLVLQATEGNDFWYEHILLTSNRTSYAAVVGNYSLYLPNNTNSTDYMYNRMLEVLVDLDAAMTTVMTKYITTIDPKDLTEVGKVVFRDEPVVYNPRFPGSENVYKPWMMNYLNTISYYLDVWKRTTYYLFDINKLALRTNFNFTLSPRFRERLQYVNRSRIGSDRTIYDIVLSSMGSRLESIVDSIILSAVDRHFEATFTLIYLSIGVGLVMLGYNIFVAWKINQVQKEYLENYNLVRPWELFLMIDELGKQKNLFTQSVFNEMMMLSQHLDFSLNSQLNSFATKVSRLQEQFERDKEKTHSTYKYNHNFFFRSSKMSFLGSFCNLGLYLVMGLTVYSFLSVNEKRIKVERMVFESHKYLLDSTKDYLGAVVMALYGYNMKLAGTDVRDRAFAHAADLYFAYQTSKRGDFVNFFGAEKAKIIDDITFGDICSYIDKYQLLRQKLTDYKDICKNISFFSASKGMTGYTQYISAYISRKNVLMLSRNQAWLNATLTAVPPSALFSETFTGRFLDARVGYYILNTIYYTVLTDIATTRASEYRDELNYLVNTTMQSIGLTVIFLLLVNFILTNMTQTQELHVCYETFRIIDPYFLVNNRYLQYRFKAAFKGVE